MAVITWALCLLLMGNLLLQGGCQHWSFGLSPGGKRNMESFSDALDGIVERFPHLGTSCGFLTCPRESPFSKIFQMRGLLASVTDKKNGHRLYKNED